MTTDKVGFTKGPWSVVERGGRAMVYQASADSTRSLAVAQARSGGTLTNDPYPVALANAHLIAAAPDMYEALAEAERMFRWYGDGHAAKPDPAKAARNYEMADRLATTLAKARGEA